MIREDFLNNSTHEGARKVLIWGMGRAYEARLNQIFFEIKKGNMKVLAIVCKPEDRYCLRRDGFYVISPEEVPQYDFDYIVVMTNLFFSEVRRQCMRLGVSLDRIIDGEIFKMPYFDFGKYASLIENPVTILSDDCWGGRVYHRLGLKFSSPTVNIWWNRGEYARFIEDPKFFLESELKMEEEGDITKGINPKGSLGVGNDRVVLHMVHEHTFAQAKEKWDRRRERINYDNIFIKMGFTTNLDEECKKKCFSAFDKVNTKKILVYYGDRDDAFITERFIHHDRYYGRVEWFDYNAYFRLQYFNDINIFNLLVDGKNYSRYE